MGGNLGGPNPFGRTWGTPGPGGQGGPQDSPPPTSVRPGSVAPGSVPPGSVPPGSVPPAAPAPPGAAPPAWGAPQQPWTPAGPQRAYQQFPAQPGPPRSGGAGAGNKLLIFGGIAAVVVIGLVCALLAALMPGGGGARFDDDPSKHQTRIAATDLTAAATELSQNPGVRYTGSFRDKHGDEVTVDAKLTNLGWTRATLTRLGTKLSVLSNGTRTYLKAGKTYWSSHGAPRDSVGAYAKAWVRVTPDDIGIDLSGALAPAALASDLQLAVERGEVRGGTETKLDGVKVHEVSTRYATVYVTVAKPQQVVRVASRDAANPGPSGKGGGFEVVPAVGGSGTAGGHVTRMLGPAGPDEFGFDLTGLSPDEVKSLFAELEKRVGELKDSVDSQVTFSLNGGIALNPCTVSGCTATVSMSNSVSSSSPYLAVKRPVVARITINMTLDKRPVKSCKASKKMQPNGSATAKCHASYSVPADGRTHHIEAIAYAVAQATVSADIKQMFDDLKAERTQGPPKQPGKDGDLGPRWKPCDPSTIPRSTGCEDVAAKILAKIGGKEHTIKPRQERHASNLGSYRGYDSEWTSHTVVVKDGRVYDAWTSRYGEPIDLYKSHWGEDAEYFIDFGF